MTTAHPKMEIDLFTKHALSWITAQPVEIIKLKEGREPVANLLIPILESLAEPFKKPANDSKEVLSSAVTPTKEELSLNAPKACVEEVQKQPRRSPKRGFDL